MNNINKRSFKSEKIIKIICHSLIELPNSHDKHYFDSKFARTFINFIIFDLKKKRR